jgi:hypothetical protein
MPFISLFSLWLFTHLFINSYYYLQDSLLPTCVIVFKGVIFLWLAEFTTTRYWASTVCKFHYQCPLRGKNREIWPNSAFINRTAADRPRSWSRPKKMLRVPTMPYLAWTSHVSVTCTTGRVVTIWFMWWRLTLWYTRVSSITLRIGSPRLRGMWWV